MQQQQVCTWGGRSIDLTTPRVMGILNVTPDSFSDGGKLGVEGRSGVFFVSVEKALAAARLMLQEGAEIIDVGGESTRPNAPAVSVQEELDRVIPVVEALSRTGAIVSVDSSTPEVFTEAARCGAALINDVRALQRPGALQAAAATGMGVCLMHMQGEPATMQDAPVYEDVVEEVCAFLSERVAACEAAGIPRQRLLIDPGFGFGKTVMHNFTLLRNLGELNRIGIPLLAGVSRKSMIGAITGRPPQQRVAGSLAAALYAVSAGAKIIRTHDVAATVDALKVVARIHEN